MVPTEALGSADLCTAFDAKELQAEGLAACKRLSIEFPSVPPTRIEALLSVALSRTMDSAIDTFRVVLAERATRARLHAEHEGRGALT
jgi:hypothetical protein